ncbi:unnamed protein product [Clonostachys chloroleuca]|uniref:Epoxide hydrolase N-terminal domain-containing protein n=1 Tax=Clonostachys chloroleuca TaxID=1926264 RepID=A0AA35PZ36_9HYPO|nr:unnamed protein product [Clonostachys chloroleuca]
MSHQVFARVPNFVEQAPSAFTLRVSEDSISEFHQLLDLSKVGPPTWEGSQSDRRFGITREWLLNAKSVWLNQFNWRQFEERINSYPNFIMDVPVDYGSDGFKIHFVALFSARQDAKPVVFLHGWPGSFVEFLPILEILSSRHTPDTLPYHVIVPSLPGYTLSAGPPLDRDFTMSDAAELIHGLMMRLGFSDGYVAQGGDVGSILATTLSATYEQCKAVHLNLWVVPDSSEERSNGAYQREIDITMAHRAELFRTTGMAYAIEHATRPSTIGLVLSSSPLALLSWIGEKFLDWSDTRQPPSLDTILGMVSLYWFTACFPRSIWPYRNIVNANAVSVPKTKPFGYSCFPYELWTVPESMAKATAENLVFFAEYDKGGHFAALEQPELLLAGVEEFIAKL